MIAQNVQIEEFLKALADELSISETGYEQAETSYKSLGDWLHRDESTIWKFAPDVYAQGSFRLGTVIRPNSDEDEYDVDSVCELRLNKGELTQCELKQLLGQEIKAYRVSQGMKKPVREGRRCWTLDYAKGAQFHMDVVPALPNGIEQKLLLERARFDTRWADTAIAITDRNDPSYTVKTINWPRSNPKGYAEWFKSRMTTVLTHYKQMLVESLRRQGVIASVEELPDYRVRTPLQSATMLLKRHRSIMFDRESDLKPISIIITTLSAHAYNGENTIADSLSSILTNMDRDPYIHFDGYKYIIANPTDPSENFADKWEEDPRKAKAFFQWLKQAREDFGRAMGATTLQSMNEAVSTRMGAALSGRAIGKVRSVGGGLLRPASATPAAATPVFGNNPRVPTKPRGFA